MVLGISEKIILPKPFQTFVSFKRPKAIFGNALKLFRINLKISKFTTFVAHIFWEHLKIGKALVFFSAIDLLFASGSGPNEDRGPNF